MQAPMPTPVTGDECLTPEKAVGALAEFYRAFNWLVEGDVAMDIPLGGVKRGWAAISDFYRQIFSGHGEVGVTFSDYTLHESAGFFYVVGRETGALHGLEIHLDLAFRTTRLFRHDGKRWRQVHHHGSIDDPDLLRDYQAILEQLEGKRRRL